MKNFLLAKPLRTLFALLIIGLVINSFTETPAHEKDVRDLKMVYFDKKIYLDVYLVKPLSCHAVAKLLDIRPFDVKEITYYPTCSVLDNGVRFIYTENHWA